MQSDHKMKSQENKPNSKHESPLVRRSQFELSSECAGVLAISLARPWPIRCHLNWIHVNSMQVNRFEK